MTEPRPGSLTRRALDILARGETTVHAVARELGEPVWRCRGLLESIAERRKATRGHTPLVARVGPSTFALLHTVLRRQGRRRVVSADCVAIMLACRDARRPYEVQLSVPHLTCDNVREKLGKLLKAGMVTKQGLDYRVTDDGLSAIQARAEWIKASEQLAEQRRIRSLLLTENQALLLRHMRSGDVSTEDVEWILDITRSQAWNALRAMIERGLVVRSNHRRERARYKATDAGLKAIQLHMERERDAAE